jgi:hypothetical protein
MFTVPARPVTKSGRLASVWGLSLILLVLSAANADTWRTEFEGRVVSVHPDLAGVFQPGDTVTGSFMYSGTAAVPDVAFPLKSFQATFPNYTLSSTVSQLGGNDTVSFTNDRDFGNPLHDVTDMYLAILDSYTSAPPVGGFSAGIFQIRLEQRGAPPITVFEDDDILFAPPDLAEITYLNLGNLQFEGFRNVQFRVTVLRLVETIPDEADGDGVPDATDNCPTVSNPAQTDSDSDGLGDACDPDNDNDGVADSGDNCPFTANPFQENFDGDALGDACDSDPDGDGVIAGDNCPFVPNVSQADTDQDGLGDDCDVDADNDGICTASHATSVCAAGPDVCPTVPDPGQEDLDQDGIGDFCDSDLDGDGQANDADNCPIDTNVDQNDADNDGLGDTCDTDIDNDGHTNAADNCPHLANPDQADADHDGLGNACDSDLDGDGVAQGLDNCPFVANSNQLDFDHDALGDACDPDVDGDHTLNGKDICPATPTGALVNPANGCSIAQLCPCAGPRGSSQPWRDHGAYVSCVSSVSMTFANKGLITYPQRQQIVDDAWCSSCGY